jgi:hypothetical protein
MLFDPLPVAYFFKKVTFYDLLMMCQQIDAFLLSASFSR